MIWSKLKDLNTKHACAEYVRLLPLLEKNCGYSTTSMPQLQDVSDFLKGQLLRHTDSIDHFRHILFHLFLLFPFHVRQNALDSRSALSQGS